MFIFYAAFDPCEGAICRIHNFCHYNMSRFDVCNCANPWNGTNCTGKIVDPIAEATYISWYSICLVSHYDVVAQ